MTPRRSLLLSALAGLLPRLAVATPEGQRAAMAAFSAGRTPQDGRVALGLETLVENGNTVPVTVTVDSPMTEADHVQRIALYTRDNPEAEVAVFHLGPASGRAVVSTRMRLATSQPVTALALMNDGSVWRASVDVVVTLAACLEGG